jgi:hypothetical protein
LGGIGDRAIIARPLFRPQAAASLRVVATDAGGKPTCPQTGLAVPECSCDHCLEAMVREHRPALLAEQIRVKRVTKPDTSRRPRAA